MKRGLILTNAYSNMASATNQAVRLKAELEAMGVAMTIRPNRYFECRIEDSEIVALGGYDFVIYLDKDKYVSDMLEKAGVRIFNSHRAILDCDDKMTTYIRLAGEGVNIVDTMPGLLCYNSEADISEESIEAIETRIGYPVIVKECFGSLGKGVYKCDDRTELVSTMRTLKCVPHLFSKCITTSYGKDIRVIVVGDKCIAAMVRESDGDFRSNLALGGHGIPIDIDENIERIALKATRALGLDYAGVDLLFGDEAQTTENLIVCEVNSNAFFGGIEAVTGVNVAKAYADYIVSEMYPDKSELLDNCNHIGITLLAIERCNHKLKTAYNMDELLFMCRTIILGAKSNIVRHGKNWYVDNGSVRFTINSTTFMIVTADRLTNID